MIKEIAYILVFIFLISCNSNQKNNLPETSKVANSENNSNTKPKFDLNGTWGLTNYFDTIIKNKELAKYRLQSPTWFAILLKIENDTLKSFGSIDNYKFIINKASDTLVTFTSNISNDTWFLIQKKEKLKLIQDSNSLRRDSTIYIFEKRKYFSEFSVKNRNFFVLGKDITKYFNKELFSGKYTNTKTKKEVIFRENGELIGLDGFDSYEVRNYFGTLHMYKNLDVITFMRKKKKSKQYNWIFKENELLLTEFIFEKITHKGKTYEGDFIVLGNEKMKLTKH